MGTVAEEADGMSGVNILEITRFFAVLHGSLGRFIVGAGTAFRDAGRRNFRDDISDGGGGRFDAAGAHDIADRADPHDQVTDFLSSGGWGQLIDWQPLAAAANTRSLMAKINTRHR